MDLWNYVYDSNTEGYCLNNTSTECNKNEFLILEENNENRNLIENILLTKVEGANIKGNWQ